MQSVANALATAARCRSTSGLIPVLVQQLLLPLPLRTRQALRSSLLSKQDRKSWDFLCLSLKRLAERSPWSGLDKHLCSATGLVGATGRWRSVERQHGLLPSYISVDSPFTWPLAVPLTYLLALCLFSTDFANMSSMCLNKGKKDITYSEYCLPKSGINCPSCAKFSDYHLIMFMLYVSNCLKLPLVRHKQFPFYFKVTTAAYEGSWKGS